MVVFYTLLVLGSIAAMAGTVIVTVRDGYRRMPTVKA